MATPLPCPKCVAGSGKPTGHRGRHRLALDSEDEQDGMDDTNAPCPKCAEGSGNKIGHRGRHKVVKLKNVKKTVKHIATDTKVPCPKCVEGSGKPTGHRGRHRLALDSEDEEDGMDDSGAPCPKCAEGSGNKIGHRGRHKGGKLKVEKAGRCTTNEAEKA